MRQIALNDVNLVVFVNYTECIILTSNRFLLAVYSVAQLSTAIFNIVQECLRSSGQIIRNENRLILDHIGAQVIVLFVELKHFPDISVPNSVHLSHFFRLCRCELTHHYNSVGFDVFN